MKKLLARLWHEEDGQDLTEYALLLVLLVLAAIGSLSGLKSIKTRMTLSGGGSIRSGYK